MNPLGSTQLQGSRLSSPNDCTVPLRRISHCRSQYDLSRGLMLKSGGLFAAVGGLHLWLQHDFICWAAMQWRWVCVFHLFYFIWVDKRSFNFSSLLHIFKLMITILCQSLYFTLTVFNVMFNGVELQLYWDYWFLTLTANQSTVQFSAPPCGGAVNSGFWIGTNHFLFLSLSLCGTFNNVIFTFHSFK